MVSGASASNIFCIFRPVRPFILYQTLHKSEHNSAMRPKNHHHQDTTSTSWKIKLKASGSPSELFDGDDGGERKKAVRRPPIHCHLRGHEDLLLDGHVLQLPRGGRLPPLPGLHDGRRYLGEQRPRFEKPRSEPILHRIYQEANRKNRSANPKRSVDFRVPKRTTYLDRDRWASTGRRHRNGGQSQAGGGGGGGGESGGGSTSSHRRGAGAEERGGAEESERAAAAAEGRRTGGACFGDAGVGCEAAEHNLR